MLGAVSPGQATSLPCPGPGSHPFTFLAAADTMPWSVSRVSTQAQTGPRSSPGLGHTNTLWCREVGPRFTNPERALT